MLLMVFLATFKSEVLVWGGSTYNEELDFIETYGRSP